MNCSQVRALLAIFRELNPREKQDLELHLAQCDECKEASAQYQVIGERIRSMPQIEPSPDAHDKLMHALAAEHVRYLQRTPATAASIPTPAFLAPYLKELAQKTPHIHSLAALSTAETGPLAVVQPAASRRNVHRSIQMRHFTVVGIAASFLVIIMTTGLLSLLYLANHGQQGPTVSSARITGALAVGQANVAQLSVNSDHPHVASACTSNNKVYYSAYNEDASNWALEVFDQQNASHTTASSTPLITTDAHPVVVLGCTDNWLLWLQMKASSPKNTASSQKINTRSSKDTTSASGTNSAPQTQHVNKLSGAWSLKALSIGATTSAAQPTATPTAQTSDKNQKNNKHAVNKTQAQSTTLAQPLTLHSDTFSSVEPDWVTTPIQGVSFYQDHALVTYLDSKGISHLLEYHFTDQKVSESNEIAHAESGHVLTSPTATADGHSLYWAEEWYTDAHGLSSNIWTRQEVNTQKDAGRMTSHLQAELYQYRSDENSFRPQIVDNTLFLISKDPETIIQPGQATTSAAGTTQATTTPTATAKGQVNVTAKSAASATATVQPQQDVSPYLGNLINVDPSVYTPQIDQNVTGKLQAFVATGATPANTTIDDNQIVVGLYGGASYLIWKEINGKYTMYDVRSKAPVGGITDIDKNAAFVSISSNTVIWTHYIAPADQSNQSNTNNTSNNPTTNQITFTVLKWPR